MREAPTQPAAASEAGMGVAWRIAWRVAFGGTAGEGGTDKVQTRDSRSAMAPWPAGLSEDEQRGDEQGGDEQGGDERGGG